MPVERSGFRPQPFDESKIHGDATFLRAQVAKTLEPEEIKAKGLMDMHSHEALGVSDDMEAFEQATRNGQAEINDLFTQKEEEIRDFLAAHLPNAEVEPFLGKLRDEWHENHDLHKNTLGLIAEKEKKTAPSPEEVYKEAAKPKSAPPPGALAAPGAAPSIPGFDINDIIKKFKEMYQADQLATQLGKAFTGGSSPIPGLDEALHEWNKSTLLSTTADLEKRERLYERIKGLISGNVPEDQAAKGQPKKGAEETAPPKPSLRTGGPEAGAPVQGVGGAGPGRIPKPTVQFTEFSDIIRDLIENGGLTRFTPDFIRDDFEKFFPTFKNLPLDQQLKALQDWGTQELKNRKADFDKFDPSGDFAQRFQVACVINVDNNPKIAAFNNVFIKVFNLALSNPLGLPTPPNLVFIKNIWEAVFWDATNAYPDISDLSGMLSTNDFFKKDPYLEYPGLTFDQVKAFYDAIPGLAGWTPIPKPTLLEQAIYGAFYWMNTASSVQETDLANAAFRKALSLAKDGKTMADLFKWAQGVVSDPNDPDYSKFTRGDWNAKVTFEQITGFDLKLLPLWNQVKAWMNNAPKDSATHALALDLFNEISRIVLDPNGTLKDVQKWFNDKFAKQDVYWQYMCTDPNEADSIQKTLSEFLGSQIAGPTEFDKFYFATVQYAKSLTGADLTFWNSFIAQLKDMGSKGTMADLKIWADKIVSSDPLYKNASFATKLEFLQRTGFNIPLYQQYQDALKWLNSIDSKDILSKTIATQLLRDIENLIPNGTFAQLQTLEIKNLRTGNLDFFKMTEANLNSFFNITGTQLEAIRHRILDWAKNPVETTLLNSILAQINTLENGTPGDMTTQLLAFMNGLFTKGIYFDNVKLPDFLTVLRLTDLCKLIDPSQTKLAPPPLNPMDQILLDALKFTTGADATFWNNFVKAIVGVGHNGDVAKLQEWAKKNIFNTVENFKAIFLNLSQDSQIQFMRLTGTALEPTRMKLLLWAESLPANDPARQLLQAIYDQINSVEKTNFSSSIQDLLNALKTTVFAAGDIYYRFAGITEAQMQEIGKMLGINLPLATAMDKILYQCYRYTSSTDGGLFKSISDYLRTHPETSNWTIKQFQDWAYSAASGLSLNDPAAFWNTKYPNFSTDDIKELKKITGLDVPVKPPSPPIPPDVNPDIQKFFNSLAGLKFVVERYAMRLGKQWDQLTDTDWANFLKALKPTGTIARDVLAGRGKNWGISDANQLAMFTGMVASRSAGEFTAAYKLFDKIHKELPGLKNLEQLRAWIKTLDPGLISQLRGADLDEFNKLAKL